MTIRVHTDTDTNKERLSERERDREREERYIDRCSKQRKGDDYNNSKT